MSKENLTKELVEKLYKEGFSIRKIGAKLGYSDKTIKNFMIANNIEFQKRNIEKLSTEIKNQINKLYYQGLNPREIGDVLNLSKSKVKSYLVQNNLWIKQEDLEKKELMQMYRVEKLTMIQIAERKNCSVKKVQLALKKYNIKKIYYKFNKTELQLFYSKYHMKPKKIALIKNTSVWFVNKALKEYNIVS